jgi:cobaltochelatase CobS
MKDYKPTSVELMSLQCALEISNFIKRRGAVRAVAYEVLRKCLKVEDVAQMMDESPLIGGGKGQVKASRSVKGLRDSLSMQALVNVAADGSKAIGLAAQAMRQPEMVGVKATKAKTGYALGAHSMMRAEEDVKTWLAEKLAGKEEDVKDMSQKIKLAGISEAPLDMLLDVLSLAADVAGVSCHDVAVVMADACEGADKVRAAALAKYVKGLNEAELSELEERHKGVMHLRAPDMAEQVAAMLESVGGDVSEPEEKRITPKAKRPSKEAQKLIDMALHAADMPSIGEMLDAMDELTETLVTQEKVIDRMRKSAATATPVMAGPVAEGDGSTPDGSVTLVPACDVFGIKKGKEMFRFEVPVWTWDHPHHDVPVLDEAYIFRPYELMCVLIALVKNKPTYLHGHTGTGKTTLIEQVCARLGWPVFRINFDSEITRMDLLGRDTLITEEGVTVSEFSEGVIPRYMQQGYVMIFDEFDFIRADVSYVMQRVLEKDKLVLTEDRGRLIAPHPMMRLFATGNTVGQGDEFGLYQGARVQSMALLNRFTNWKRIDYLDEGERMKLIKLAGPGLDKPMSEMVGQYVCEHMEAFLENRSVMQPISPRDFTALADQLQTYLAYFPSHLRSKAIEEAFNTVILDRASTQDRLVLAGIVDRVKR